jgi:hypothetical protein
VLFPERFIGLAKVLPPSVLFEKNTSVFPDCVSSQRANIPSLDAIISGVWASDAMLLIRTGIVKLGDVVWAKLGTIPDRTKIDRITNANTFTH